MQRDAVFILLQVHFGGIVTQCLRPERVQQKKTVEHYIVGVQVLIGKVDLLVDITVGEWVNAAALVDTVADNARYVWQQVAFVFSVPTLVPVFTFKDQLTPSVKNPEFIFF